MEPASPHISPAAVVQLIIALGIIVSASFPGGFLTRLGTRVHTATYLAISVGVGAIIAQIAFHLLPEIEHEVLESYGVLATIGLVCAGYLIMVAIEKALHKHHGEGSVKSLLLPSAFHNIFDGVVIGLSFTLSPLLGWGAAAAVFLHELALKTSLFSLLFEKGLSATQATRALVTASLTIVVGAAAGIFLGEAAHEVAWSLPVITGGYLCLLQAMVQTLYQKRDGQRIWRTAAAGMMGVALLGALFLSAAPH
jgi:zinc transporter ZupT